MTTVHPYDMTDATPDPDEEDVAEITLVEAIGLVVADRRATRPEFTIAEAVDDARHRVGPNDDGTRDDLSSAYLAVLNADPKSLIEAEAVIANDPRGECIECINRDMNGLAPIHDHTGGN